MHNSLDARDPFGVRDTLQTAQGPAAIYRLARLEDQGIAPVSRLPYSVRILLEAVLRGCDGYVIREEDIRNVATWSAAKPAEVEIPFPPARVVLQDFTGVPAVVDLAAMRSAMKRLGGNPQKINPLIPVDLVIDHSVQVDRFGDSRRWPTISISSSRVIGNDTSSCAGVNARSPTLASCRLVSGSCIKSIWRCWPRACSSAKIERGLVAVPDSLVGTDSHTTMINGLGVVGWGVGGIEAEAVMLGQPIYMLLPEVVGFELTGGLSAGVTATDAVLTITQILRRAGVVGKFVEFYGTGVDSMSLADRATIANMALSMARRWATSRSTRRPFGSCTAPVARKTKWHLSKRT